MKFVFIILLLLAQLAAPSAVTGKPIAQMQLVDDYSPIHGLWTDENGVRCLSDENLHNRTWLADKFTGTLTATLYFCPWNPNAPTGPQNYSVWASFAIANGRGAASISVTYPDGTVVPGRYNPVTGWTEMCVVKNPYYVDPGVYTMTFTATNTRAPIVHFDTKFAESVRGQHWWGCDPSWWL